MQKLHLRSACIYYLQLSPEDFSFSFAFKSLLSSSQRGTLNKKLAGKIGWEMSFLGLQSLYSKESLEGPAKMVATNTTHTLCVAITSLL